MQGPRLPGAAAPTVAPPCVDVQSPPDGTARRRGFPVAGPSGPSNAPKAIASIFCIVASPKLILRWFHPPVSQSDFAYRQTQYRGAGAPATKGTGPVPLLRQFQPVQRRHHMPSTLQICSARQKMRALFGHAVPTAAPSFSSCPRPRSGCGHFVSATLDQQAPRLPALDSGKPRSIPRDKAPRKSFPVPSSNPDSTTDGRF